MAKVSIIMPTYNVEKYFRQCLESVINQTLEDIEIIPVDDGSPDNCGKIMDEYAAKDSRIKPIHQQNGGYGKAVNAGINAATGEYIGIVETDDWIEPDMYEKLYTRAKELDADVCDSGFYVYNSQGKEKKQNVKWIHPNENIDFFPDDRSFTIAEQPKLIMKHASIWAKIYKTSFLKSNDIRVNETMAASYQDFPFMVEIMCKAKRIAVVKDYFYHWRVEDNSNSSTTRNDAKLMIMAQQCEEVKRIIKEQGLYEILKEPIYRHFASANYDFFKRINLIYKKEYFEKIYHLFKDLIQDKNFSYLYFSKKEKTFVKAVLTHNYYLTILSLGFKHFRKMFIRCNLFGDKKYLFILNHQIV